MSDHGGAFFDPRVIVEILSAMPSETGDHCSCFILMRAPAQPYPSDDSGGGTLSALTLDPESREAEFTCGGLTITMPVKVVKRQNGALRLEHHVPTLHLVMDLQPDGSFTLSGKTRPRITKRKRHTI